MCRGYLLRSKNTDLYTCLSLCHSCRTDKELYTGCEISDYAVLPATTLYTDNSGHPQYDIVNTLKKHIGKDDKSSMNHFVSVLNGFVYK